MDQHFAIALLLRSAASVIVRLRRTYGTLWHWVQR